MKYDNFPRIYSLSTIGIKQHYNADYLFHPYRTDFSGDSGSGKSMVADIIQLVLVGSSDFKSSTDGNKQRDVKGLLASDKGKSSSRGYVFLNVEMKPKRYFVIGAYIEGTNNAADMFIMQNGYDWEEMTPLEKPIFTDTLLMDDKIETLSVLCEKLTVARMKSFKKKNYHRILHNNDILSLDLTKESTLKAYANILRSFSRGKGFKTESENLKKFLFGDEEQGIIMEKYKEEVTNINNDFHEHKRYLEEIQLIKEKQKTLQDLVDKSKQYKAVYSEYLIQRFNYWNTIKKSQTATVELTQSKITDHKAELRFVKLAEEKLRIADLKDLCKLKSDLDRGMLTDEAKKLIEERYLAAKQDNSAIKALRDWLSSHNDDMVGLERWYEEQKALLSDKTSLKLFTDHLNKYSIREAFEQSGWHGGFAEESSGYASRIAKLDEDIANLKSLSVFTDIENPESLLRWAVANLLFPISKEEESILVYFQKFGKTKPMKNAISRYVPFPDMLFKGVSAKIKDADDQGFWVDLDGVYEYIPFISSPVLDVDNPDMIKEILAKLKEGTDSNIKKLTQERQQRENLRDILFKFGDLDKHIAVYLRKESIAERSVSPDFEILNEYTFETLKGYLAQEQTHKKDFQKHKGDYEDMIQSEKIIEESKSRIKLLEGRYFSKDTIPDLPGLEAIIAKSEEKWLEDSRAADDFIIGINHEKLKQEDYYRVINDALVLANRRNQLESNLENYGRTVVNSQKYCGEAEHELADTLQHNIVKGLNLTFDKEKEESVNPDQGGVQSLKQRALTAHSSYEEYLKLVTGGSNFDVTVSIGKLASHFLPTVFQGPAPDEELISFNISERLQKLTQDIQEIGSRKIEILGSIFNEVYQVYSGYLTKITMIDNYLKNHNRMITGGNRASLSSSKSLYYPDTWLSSFRKQLNSQIGSTGLFSELREELDINKMMIQAFQQLGGSPKVEPADLMNPLSYFDLQFDLKLDNNEINSGSNGQTYAANALLCLARLSLIEDKSGKGIKVMPIDEAEGLGSNYDMLHELAKREKYQIITMAIETAGEIREGDQYIYIMNENKGTDMDSYVPPFGIFSDPDTIVEDISNYINTLPEDE